MQKGFAIVLHSILHGGTCLLKLFKFRIFIHSIFHNEILCLVYVNDDGHSADFLNGQNFNFCVDILMNYLCQCSSGSTDLFLMCFDDSNSPLRIDLFPLF